MMRGTLLAALLVVLPSGASAQEPRSVDLAAASPLAGASMTKTAAGFELITHPASGGYSALIVLGPLKALDGPARVVAELRVADGSIGLAALNADGEILAEACADAGAGPHELAITVLSTSKVNSLLLRNCNQSGVPSKGILQNIRVQRCDECPTYQTHFRSTNKGTSFVIQTRKFLSANGANASELSSHYWHRQLGLKVDETVAIVIDAWARHPNKGWAQRGDINIRSKLVPTLQELRRLLSSPQFILQAAV